MGSGAVVASDIKKPRRSRARPISPGVVARMDTLEKDLQGVLKNQGLNQMTLQRVEGKMDAILLLVGSEEEDGDGGFKGVGLLGRMRRVEDSQTNLMSKYRTWIAWGGGFISAGTVMTAFIWWLVSDKLELVLKGTNAS